MTSKTFLTQLTIDQEPVKELYPGWEAVSRHSAPGDIDVVLFHEHHIKREACWWVTSEGAYLASHTLALQSDEQKKIIDQLMPILLPLMEETLIDKPKTPLLTDHPVFQNLVALPMTALTELVGLWCHYMAPGTIMLSLRELLDNHEAHKEENNEQYNSSPFSAERMQQAMSCHYEKSQPIVVISPFSSLPLKPQLTIKYQMGVICRFFDSLEDVTFYLFWPSSHHGDNPVFYYPRGPLIIGDSHEAGLLPTRLMVWFLQHPEHFDIIQNSPSFRLEDYGVGHTSDIWKTFSASTEGNIKAVSPPEHTPIWDR